jgi:hypothetical protein
MKNYLIAFGLLFITVACKKKKEIETQETQVTTPAPSQPAYSAKDYFALKPGNYWVYQRQQIDTNNAVVYTSVDRSYVYDSIITRGKKFYAVWANPILTGYYTDSANCIISTNGTIIFREPGNDNDTISKINYSQNTQWYNLYYVMKSSTTAYNFNGNTYNNCANRYGYFYSNMNAACPNRTFYQSFSPGAGMVYCEYFFASLCDRYVLKLLRYKVN